MDLTRLSEILKTMNQEEVLTVLSAEVRSAKSLHKKTYSYNPISGTYNARTDGKNWATSEQYEKSKDAIRTIVKHLF